MSLLDPPTKPVLAQRRATFALGLPHLLFKNLLKHWAASSDAVWASPDPSGVLSAMGKSAGEWSALQGEVAAFLESKRPGITKTFAARIKPHTINADGTVTVAPAPSPPPAAAPK